MNQLQQSGHLLNTTTKLITIIVTALALLAGRTIWADGLSLVAGENHACLQVNGKVFCWGDDNYGQLGNGTYATAPTPVAVQGMTTATTLSAKVNHSCALLKDGGVSCWGLNDYSKLTNPTVNMVMYNNTPLPVAGIKNATAVVEGTSHACALLNDGSVQCWGSNASGQLGDGTYKNASTPVPVKGLINAVAIAAGGYRSCALIQDGSVQCWGSYVYDPEKVNLGNSEPPIPVKGLANAVAVTMGYDHSCAIIKDGSVQCWGYNGYMQLGNETKKASNTPVPVVNVSNAVAVAAGVNTTCAVSKNGNVQCWGLGLSEYSDQPKSKLMNVANAVTVAVHYSGACALIKDGSVQCWKNGPNPKPYTVELDPNTIQPAISDSCNSDDLSKAKQDAATCASDLKKAKTDPSPSCPYIKQIPPNAVELIPASIYSRILYYGGCK